MIPHCPREERNRHEVFVDGVPMKLSCYAPFNIRVSTRTFHILFESYENSWGTMVTLRTTRTSAAKGTSLLTLSLSL